MDVCDTLINSKANGVFCDIEENMFMAMINCNDIEQLNLIEQELSDMGINIFKIGFCRGVSNIFYDLESLPTAYMEAIKAVEYGILFGYKGSIYYSEIEDKNGDNYKYPINEEIRLINSIKLKNIDEAYYYIDKIINSFIENEKIDCATIQHIITGILSVMIRELPLQKIYKEDVFKLVLQKKSLIEIRLYLQQFCKEIIDYLNNYTKDENKYCKLAKKYIKQHYTENISITDVADYLDISYPYLSKIFKTYININILDYLNTIRIQNSKELLIKTNNTLSDIASKVGYNNTQSFNRFFKKYEGITPGEYRKINEKAEK